MNRRRFLYASGVFAITTGTAGFLSACSKDDSDPGPGNGGGGNGSKFSANLNSELTAIGSSKTQNNIIVVRTASGNTSSSFIAFTSICTHEACTVGFQSTKFVCPCHGSEYNMEGSVIQGPAMRPLTRYTVAIDSSGVLTVS